MADRKQEATWEKKYLTALSTGVELRALGRSSRLPARDRIVYMEELGNRMFAKMIHSCCAVSWVWRFLAPEIARKVQR